VQAKYVHFTISATQIFCDFDSTVVDRYLKPSSYSKPRPPSLPGFDEYDINRLVV